MITAIVLAAGKSSRMPGKNKMFLPFRDTTVVSNVIAELIVSDVDEIVIVTDSEEHLNELVIVSKVRACVNKKAEKGMTSSIQQGVAFANKNSAYMVCLGDMPLITHKEYNKLINRFLKNNQEYIIQPIKNKAIGNPVIFPNQFRKEILDLEDPNGCRPILKANKQLVDRVTVSSEAFFKDIDTIEEYNELLRNWS